MKTIKCSMEKFIMLYGKIYTLEDRFNKAKSIDILPYEHSLNGRRVVYHTQNMKYRNGLQVYKAKDEQDRVVYWVNDTLVIGADYLKTQIFMQEGIDTICLSDNKETLIFSKDGLVAQQKTGKSYAYLSKCILKELKGAKYYNGLVRTPHFTGAYQDIDAQYKLIRICSISDEENVGIQEMYSAIIENRTGAILEDMLFYDVREIGGYEAPFDGLVHCITNSDNSVGKLIDLKTKRVILNDVIMHIHGCYISAYRILKYKYRSVTVYVFDEDTRKLITVVPEIERAFTKYNHYTSALEMANISVLYTKNGLQKRMKEKGTKISNLIVRLYLYPTETGKDQIVWADMNVYSELKHLIGREV